VSTLFCAAAIGTGSLGLVEALGVLVVGAGVSLRVSAPPQPEEGPVGAPYVLRAVSSAAVMALADFYRKRPGEAVSPSH
jgi:hypothetical protein